MIGCSIFYFSHWLFVIHLFSSALFKISSLSLTSSQDSGAMVCKKSSYLAESFSDRVLCILKNHSSSFTRRVYHYFRVIPQFRQSFSTSASLSFSTCLLNVASVGLEAPGGMKVHLFLNLQRGSVAPPVTTFNILWEKKCFECSCLKNCRNKPLISMH